MESQNFRTPSETEKPVHDQSRWQRQSLPEPWHPLEPGNITFVGNAAEASPGCEEPGDHPISR